MSKYIGSSAVNLSTTSADVTGNADIDGNLTIGGNLTVSGTTITVDHATAQTVDLGDGDKIRLGDDNDLQIYHDGSNSYVQDVGVGNLYLKGTNLFLQDADGNDFIALSDGGAGGTVYLKHFGTTRLNTTGTGIDVTGTATADKVSVVHAGGGDFVGVFQNTTSATPYGVHIKDAASGANGYPLLQVTNSAGSSPYLLVHSGTGNVGIAVNDPDAVLDISGGSNKLGILRVTQRLSGATAYGLDVGLDPTSGDPVFSRIVDDVVSESFRIQRSSGDLHIGTDSAGSYPKAGHSIRGGDSAVFSRTGTTGETMQIRRDNSTGEQIRFYRGASTINGAIGDGGGALYIRGNTNGIMFNGSSIEPVGNSSTGGRVSNTVDIGAASYRFKDAYLSGGIYLGGTGAANKLEDYEEGLHTYTLTGANSGSATIPIRSGYTKLAYTKIGRMVTITGKIETLGSHSTSGALRLSLPFTAANLSDQAGVAGGSCFIYRTSQSIYDNPVILPDTSSPYAIFYYNTTSGDVGAINANNLDSAFEIIVSFSYFTNA